MELGRDIVPAMACPQARLLHFGTILSVGVTLASTGRAQSDAPNSAGSDQGELRSREGGFYLRGGLGGCWLRSTAEPVVGSGPTTTSEGTCVAGDLFLGARLHQIAIGGGVVGNFNPRSFVILGAVFDVPLEPEGGFHFGFVPGVSIARYQAFVNGEERTDTGTGPGLAVFAGYDIPRPTSGPSFGVYARGAAGAEAHRFDSTLEWGVKTVDAAILLTAVYY